MLRSRLPGYLQVPGALIILGTFAVIGVLSTIIGLVFVWAGPAWVRPGLPITLWVCAGIAAGLAWFLLAQFNKLDAARQRTLAVKAKK